jgi:hypothetical protein
MDQLVVERGNTTATSAMNVMVARPVTPPTVQRAQVSSRKILTHGVAAAFEPPRRQEREHDDAHRDRVTRQRRTPELRHDAHQADPARSCNDELRDPSQRYPHEPPHDVGLQPELRTQDSNVLRPAEQHGQLHRHAHTAADVGGDRRPLDAHRGQRPPAADVRGIERC